MHLNPLNHMVHEAAKPTKQREAKQWKQKEVLTLRELTPK